MDIAVVGAGPYGLSIAAHLRARSADYRIFGEPLSTWREHMPAGMMLKSDGFASNLSAPDPDSTLKAFCAARGIAYDDLTVPVALNTFVAYGMNFQERYVPDLERCTVQALDRSALGYKLKLSTGETVEARRVVLAVGITHFDQAPKALDELPAARWSHASAHACVKQFRGSRVAVLGSGSSAVDLAAALHEAGASVQLVARKPSLKFRALPTGKPRSLWFRIRHPTTGLGSSFRSWLCCTFPQFFRFLPAALRMSILTRHLGPSSPGYMREKIEGRVSVLTGRTLIAAEHDDHQVRLKLTSATVPSETLEVEHVISATGYRAVLDGLTFVDPALRRTIRRVGEAPAVSPYFESSAPGLYFVGVAAGPSFGPLMRFMFGAEFAAPRIVKHLMPSGA